MAIIYQGMKCALCKSVVDPNADIVSTTHFIDDPDHHLWNFSDAAMHRECFLDWKHRAEFVMLYNETFGRVWSNGACHYMHQDGRITSEPAKR